MALKKWVSIISIAVLMNFALAWFAAWAWLGIGSIDRPAAASWPSPAPVGWPAIETLAGPRAAYRNRGFGYDVMYADASEDASMLRRYAACRLRFGVPFPSLSASYWRSVDETSGIALEQLPRVSALDRGIVLGPPARQGLVPSMLLPIMPEPWMFGANVAVFAAAGWTAYRAYLAVKRRDRSTASPREY